MSLFDKIGRATESTARGIARRTSRRGFFGSLGAAVVGAAVAAHLVPVTGTKPSRHSHL